MVAALYRHRRDVDIETEIAAEGSVEVFEDGKIRIPVGGVGNVVHERCDGCLHAAKSIAIDVMVAQVRERDGEHV